jgi:hypothetical protein
MNNLAPEEELIIQEKYLTKLSELEEAITTATDNLDTDRAAVWYHNKNEVRDRKNLFDLWCKRLKDFLGVIPDDMRFSEGSGVRVIV